MSDTDIGRLFSKQVPIMLSPFFIALEDKNDFDNPLEAFTSKAKILNLQPNSI